jgi:nucleotide-binding universal stress UspA family protein
MFSKIVVAIDGSEPSIDAAENAIAMAKRYDADLIALHVIPRGIRYEYPEDHKGPDISTTPLMGIVESHQQEAEEWFNKVREIAKKENNNIKLDTDVVIATKSTVAEIVDYAADHKVDLIVIGTRGRSGFKKLLLGSVASGVVNYAHCPVMVVK